MRVCAPDCAAIELVRDVSGKLLFVRIALGDSCPFYTQGRLGHPHVLADGAAKLLRQFSQLRFGLGSERLGAKNANARAQLFNLIFG